MELPARIKREAFRAGYRLGIRAGSFYDWVKARDANRPEDARPGAWVEEFDKIANEAMTVGTERLGKAVEELDGRTEAEIDAFMKRSGNGAIAEYPPTGDPLADIDAGVDDLPDSARP